VAADKVALFKAWMGVAELRDRLATAV